MDHKGLFSCALDAEVVRLPGGVEVYALEAQLAKLPGGNHTYTQDANLLTVF